MIVIHNLINVLRQLFFFFLFLIIIILNNFSTTFPYRILSRKNSNDPLRNVIQAYIINQQIE